MGRRLRLASAAMRFDFLARRSRRVVAAMVLFLAVAGGLGTLRWTIPTGWSEARLRQALARTTGYRVESLGDAQFSALPWPTIHVSNLKLGRPDAPKERIEAALVKGRLNAFSWLFGEPRLVELALFDPVIDLASADESSRAGAGDAAVSTAIIDLLERDRRHELRALRIERGTLRLAGRVWMSDLALKLTGGVGADLRLAASGLQETQPIQVRAEVSPMRGQERRPVRSTVVAPSFTASFVGTLYGPRSLDAEGELSIAIVDGSAIARRLDLPAGQASLLDGLAASGRARFAWPAVQVRDARIERGQTRLDGSIEIIFDQTRTALAATLDTQRFDITPFLTPLANGLADHDGRWSNEPLASGSLNAAALDLRLSAGQLIAGSAVIDNAALSMQIGSGRMDLMLSDGRLRSGVVKGRLTLAELADSRFDARLQASIERLDLAQLAGPSGAPRMRGLASGQLSLKSAGGTVAAMIGAAEGKIDAVVRDGELPGIDLDRAAQRPETATNGSADRRTRFNSITLQMLLTDGRARVTEGTVLTSLNRALIEGTVGLAGRTVDLTLRASPIPPATRPSDVRIRIEGPWSAPTVAY